MEVESLFTAIPPQKGAWYSGQCACLGVRASISRWQCGCLSHSCLIGSRGSVAFVCPAGWVSAAVVRSSRRYSARLRQEPYRLSFITRRSPPALGCVDRLVGVGILIRLDASVPSGQLKDVAK